jgi:hypothetical protein
VHRKATCDHCPLNAARYISGILRADWFWDNKLCCRLLLSGIQATDVDVNGDFSSLRLCERTVFSLVRGEILLSLLDGPFSLLCRTHVLLSVGETSWFIFLFTPSATSLIMSTKLGTVVDEVDQISMRNASLGFISFPLASVVYASWWS